MSLGGTNADGVFASAIGCLSRGHGMLSGYLT